MPASLTDRQAAVLGWWEGQRRDLPWRQTRDPWEVLVCEVMAQQTQVARVAERWRPFLDRFPTPAALRRRRRSPRPSAGGPGSATTAAPSPCTAPRRPSSSDHGGRLPADLDALLALPGIGPYTARAVLAFAFEADHGVVDTNTARVLARWAGRPARAPREAQAAADARRARRPGLGVEPGDARPRRHRVHPTRAPLRRVPGRATSCAWAASRPPRARSGRRVRRRVRRSVPLRGQRPPGPRPPGRGAQIAGPSRPHELAEVMGWPDDPRRADRVAATLLGDGLVTRQVTGHGDRYRLAGG